MENRSDFTVDGSVFQEAVDSIEKLMPQYREAVERIRKVTEPLIDGTNWRGKARDEFKDTFRIVDHYLTDDTDQISSIADALRGFKEIYETLDVDSAKKVYDTVSEAFSTDAT